MGVMPHTYVELDAHFAPVLNFAVFYHNEKHYKFVIRYAWKGK